MKAVRVCLFACALISSLFAEESNVYFVGDFLWWKAENAGFSYAFNQTSDATTFPNVGEVKQIDADWKPGFQIGMGFNTKYSGWDLFTNWTWYSNISKTAQHASVPDSAVGLGFYPVWPVAKTVAGGADLGPYKDLKAQWHLLLNAVDAALSKTVLNTAGLILDLQWGVRGAWLRQKFIVDFTNPIATRVGTSLQSFDFVGKNNYWGVGPLAGLKSRWEMGRGLSLLGKIASAFLYGKNDASNVSTDPIASVVHHQFTQNFSQLVPCVQMLLGFEWASCRSDTFSFEIQAAWETNLWWNQFNVPVSFEGFAAPAPPTGNTPLTTEGITVNFQVGF